MPEVTLSLLYIIINNINIIYYKYLAQMLNLGIGLGYSYFFFSELSWNIDQCQTDTEPENQIKPPLQIYIHLKLLNNALQYC